MPLQKQYWLHLQVFYNVWDAVHSVLVFVAAVYFIIFAFVQQEEHLLKMYILHF